VLGLIFFPHVMLTIFNILVMHVMKLEEIGHEIRRSRLSRGLTQAQLAVAAHITRTTLNQLENGVIKDLAFERCRPFSINWVSQY